MSETTAAFELFVQEHRGVSEEKDFDQLKAEWKSLSEAQRFPFFYKLRKLVNDHLARGLKEQVENNIALLNNSDATPNVFTPLEIYQLQQIDHFPDRGGNKQTHITILNNWECLDAQQRKVFITKSQEMKERRDKWLEEQKNV